MHLSFPQLSLIFLAIDNGMTFTNALESTKQLYTLKFKILKVNKNDEQCVFASIVSAISTYARVAGELLGPLFEELALPVEVYLSARRRMSSCLVIFVSSSMEIFA